MLISILNGNMSNKNKIPKPAKLYLKHPQTKKKILSSIEIIDWKSVETFRPELVTL